MGEINVITTKTEFIKIIRNQKEILIGKDFSPRELSKDVMFRKQAKLIEDTARFFYKDIKLPKYKFLSFRSRVMRILLYFIAVLFLVNGMWVSFFAKSWYGNGWNEFSDFQYLLMGINVIILILFIIFFIYYRLKTEKVSKDSNDIRSVFKYHEFLIILEKKVKSTPPVEQGL